MHHLWLYPISGYSIFRKGGVILESNYYVFSEKQIFPQQPGCKLTLRQEGVNYTILLPLNFQFVASKKLAKYFNTTSFLLANFVGKIFNILYEYHTDSSFIPFSFLLLHSIHSTQYFNYFYIFFANQLEKITQDGLLPAFRMFRFLSFFVYECYGTRMYGM